MTAKQDGAKKKFVMKKSSRGANVGELGGCSAEAPVGRAVLEGIKTAKLYELLKLKNIPGRSKIREKEKRVETLAGLVTANDLAKIGVKPPREREWDEIRDWMEKARERREKMEGKRELGVRMEEPVAGIDVHSKTLVVAVATPAGITWEVTVENTPAAVEALARGLLARNVRHVAMESTAEYWQVASWALQDAGIGVLVANAAQVAATQGVKTDKLDARRLALAFRDGRLSPSVLCTPVRFQMRKLCRDARKMTAAAASALVRAKRIIRRHGVPDWLSQPGGSQRCFHILVDLLSPGGRENALDIITARYAKHSGKITDVKRLRAMAAEVTAFLDSVVSNHEHGRLMVHLRQHVQLKADALALENNALALVAKDERMLKMLRVALSFPCMGLGSALAIVVEVMDAGFFHSPKALVKWAGLAPQVKQSGYKKRATGRLYKRGNKHLRTTLYLVAQSDYAHHAREGHPFGQYIRRMFKGRQKSYKTAVVAGAAKLLRHLYVAFTLEKDFQEIWPNEECNTLQENRERKKRELAKRIRKSNLADVLTVVAQELNVAEARFDVAIEHRLDMMTTLMLQTVNAIEDYG